MVAAEERGSPALGVAREEDVVPLTLHPGDDRADAGPGVEPAAQRSDLGRLVPELEEAEDGVK